MAACCPPPTLTSGARPPNPPAVRTTFGLPEGGDPWHVWLSDRVVRFVESVKLGSLDDVASQIRESQGYRRTCAGLLSVAAMLDPAYLEPSIMRDFESREPWARSEIERAIDDANNMLDSADMLLSRRMFVLNALVVSSDMDDERRDDADK